MKKKNFIVQNLPAKMCHSSLINEYEGKIGLLTFDENSITFITDNLEPFTDEIEKITFSEVMYHRTFGYGFSVKNKNDNFYCFQTGLNEKDVKEIMNYYNNIF